MSTPLKSIALLLLGLLVVSACSGEREARETTQAKVFATPEEAAREAKDNLIEVLETHKDINLDIDVSKLRESELASVMRYVLVDFDRMLSADSVASLSAIIASEKSVVAPFIRGNEIVAVAEVAQVSSGWKVAVLGNKAIRDDINRSRAALRENATVMIYEIPNLQLMVYGVRENGRETYFLNFEQFTTAEAVAIEAFYPRMRERAIQFDKDFGDQLRKEKLLK